LRPHHRRAHRPVQAVATAAPTGTKGPPAHPVELTYPCCLPALGGLGEVPPHEGSASESTAPHAFRPTGGGAITSLAEDSPSGLWRSLGKRVGLTALAGSNPASSATLTSEDARKDSGTPLWSLAVSLSFSLIRCSPLVVVGP